MLVLYILSFILFFGFVILGVCKFGLLDCYSAYADKWNKLSPIKGLNVWSLMTILSIGLLIPPLLAVSAGSIWQFTAFLCPALILFVGMTPSFNKSKIAQTIHLVCANTSALFAVLFVLLVTPNLWWLIPMYVALAGICTLIFKQWGFWIEMAAFLLIYTVTFILLI